MDQTWMVEETTTHRNGLREMTLPEVKGVDTLRLSSGVDVTTTVMKSVPIDESWTVSKTGIVNKCRVKGWRDGFPTRKIVRT